MFDPEKSKAHANKKAWRDSGMRFQGGTLRGIEKRLEYIQGLGATTLWLAPVFKQHRDLQTYHGYGIQNFLAVEPRFGDIPALRSLIDSAHARGMYVILDIVYNHAGNILFYKKDSNSKEHYDVLPFSSNPYGFAGWRSAKGECILKAEGPEDGIWPMELQDPENFLRHGSIENYNPIPGKSILDDDNEFRLGDTMDLKKFNLKREEVLDYLIRIYQYWIAASDCDGFRIDSLKHVPIDASRKFSTAIREYTYTIGKNNFMLLGEVAGGPELQRAYLDISGRNIDAVLDIHETPRHLAMMAKGSVSPEDYFNCFKEKNEHLGVHRSLGFYHVSILDDHDMIWLGPGVHQRFTSGNSLSTRYSQSAHAVGVQLTTLGIPCIYYGTEQAFDGSDSDGDPNDGGGHSDRYVREAMGGFTFGAFRTSGYHFFNPDHSTYKRISQIANIRNSRTAAGRALRHGRQECRDVFTGNNLETPSAGCVVAWSRIHFDTEVIVVLNTSSCQTRTVDVCVDPSLNPLGTKLICLYNESQARTSQEVRAIGERLTVSIELTRAGMAILANEGSFHRTCRS